jgi:hypothetical protein
MLMGNPNLEDDDEVDDTEEGHPGNAEADADADKEEAEMDNVEALMAGVAIGEKDKVRRVLQKSLRKSD